MAVFGGGSDSRSRKSEISNTGPVSSVYGSSSSVVGGKGHILPGGSSTIYKLAKGATLTISNSTSVKGGTPAQADAALSSAIHAQQAGQATPATVAPPGGEPLDQKKIFIGLAILGAVVALVFFLRK
jgi:hypothetical protein